jgi:hypothetical protein
MHTGARPEGYNEAIDLCFLVDYFEGILESDAQSSYMHKSKAEWRQEHEAELEETRRDRARSDEEEGDLNWEGLSKRGRRVDPTLIGRLNLTRAYDRGPDLDAFEKKVKGEGRELWADIDESWQPESGVELPVKPRASAVDQEPAGLKGPSTEQAVPEPSKSCATPTTLSRSKKRRDKKKRVAEAEKSFLAGGEPAL